MDDVLAVMDAAGSERAAMLRHARGRADGDAVRRHPPRPRERAGAVRHLRPRRAGRPTTTGLARRRTRDEHDGRRASRTGARARGRPRGARARTGDPPSWSGRAGWSAWRRARGTIARIFDADRRDRRARRAPLDPRAHARDAPPRRHLHQGRALALHRRAHPGRALRGARGRATTCSRSATPRRSSARSRSSSPARATSASPTGCWPRCCSPTSCDSTERAAEMGDRGWRDLLERHDALFRRALERHRGREVKRTGDGLLATFDGPARAIRCAASVGRGDGHARAARCGPGCTRARSR